MSPADRGSLAVGQAFEPDVASLSRLLGVSAKKPICARLESLTYAALSGCADVRFTMLPSIALFPNCP